MPLETAQSGIRDFLPMPIMQDFREFDKTNRAGDVLACRKAVDVLWTAAEIDAHRLIPRHFEGTPVGRSGPCFIRSVNHSKRGANIFLDSGRSGG
jgi:hypothetical protein